MIDKYGREYTAVRLSDGRWRVDTEGLRLYTDEAGVQSALDGYKPSDYVESLSDRRASVMAKIDAERDRREQTTFPYQGKLIDSDPVSVQRITVASSTASMALSAGVPFGLDWSCADNTLLTLDAMGVLGMMQALGSHGLALHMHSRGLKSAVLTSEDPESIDIFTGWPE